MTADRQACTTCFGAQSTQADEFQNAVPDFVKKNHPDAAAHAAMLYINAGAAAENGKTQVTAMEKRGMHFDYVQGIDISEFNYAPYVQQMKDKGVEYVQMIGATAQFVRLAQAMQQQGFHPEVFMLDPTAYTRDFVQSGGDAVEGATLFINFTPFEEASSNKELQLYLSWLQQVKPGAEPSFFGLFSWSAARLFVERATALGGKLTRASLIADLLTVAGPFVVVGIGIAAANTVRFGSPTEFGFGLQLSVWDMTTYPRGRLSYLAPNLLDHVAAIPGHRSSFPWITLRPTIGGDRPSVHTSEPMIGLIFSALVLVVGAVAALPSGRAPWARARGLGTAVAAAATTGALLLVLVSWPFNTSSLRYTADGAPLLLLAAAGAWLTVRSDAPLASGTGAGTGGRRLDRAWLVALAVGIAVTAAVQVPT